MSRVAIVGTGYVGLVAAACFADTGHQVIGVDRDRKKLDRLRKGEIPIYEPGLDALVERNLANGRLRFTDSTPEAVAASDIIFLAVGTPPLPSGLPDLSQLEAAAHAVGEAMTPATNQLKVVVNKSTVPVGAHRKVADWLRERTRQRVEVVSNPEFLKEGNAVEDFLKPDRVVIGTDSDEAFGAIEELYAPFVKQGNPILRMDPISAELTKYACNSFLAVRISFMNELSRLCEETGGDIEIIRRGMASDQRIGKYFLYAGAGYGGSCFPKDIEALLATGKAHDVPLSIIQSAQDANARQKRRLPQVLKTKLGRELAQATVALWGLAFKPNTDDLREAPAYTIIDELLKEGVTQIRVFDPVAMPGAKAELQARLSPAQFAKITFADTSDKAAEGADALLLVTEWNDFRSPDFKKLKSLMRRPLILDGRNQYDPGKVRAEGFTYYGIGRGQLSS